MIVPDGIEPVEEWRTWTFDGTHLRSHNGVEWIPGEALHAACSQPSEWKWRVIRGGSHTLEQARAETDEQNQRAVNVSSFGGPSSYSFSWGAGDELLVAPTVEPPPGYGYALVSESHIGPQLTCSCGIYAGRTPDDVPAGDVLGKVKLWGKIVPGTKGSRAEYAYPSELHVPPALADDPGILAYGVPVVVTDSDKVNGGKAGFANYLLTGSTSGLSAGMAAASQNFQGFSMAMGEARQQSQPSPVSTFARIFLTLAGATSLLMGVLTHAHPARTGLWVGFGYLIALFAVELGSLIARVRA